MTIQQGGMMDREKELLPCPFCGCQPKINLGKKYHCQLRGEPRQGIVIKCDWRDCAAKPSIEAGDIYNGIGDAIYRDKATQEAINVWNNRKSPAPSKEGLRELDEEALYELISAHQTKHPNRFYDPKAMKEDRQLAIDICEKFGVKEPAEASETKIFGVKVKARSNTGFEYRKPTPPVEVTVDELAKRLRDFYRDCDTTPEEVAKSIHNLIYNQKRTQ